MPMSSSTTQPPPAWFFEPPMYASKCAFVQLLMVLGLTPTSQARQNNMEALPLAIRALKFDFREEDAGASLNIVKSSRDG